MDRPTVDVYEDRAEDWEAQRAPANTKKATTFGRKAGRPILDAGCGPGWFTDALRPEGTGVVAIDAAFAMLEATRRRAPAAQLVRADLAALPFRSGSIGACWASKSYIHVPRSATPMALHELHRILPVDARVQLTAFEGDDEFGPFADDDFAGRKFSLWPAQQLDDVLVGAGFADITISSGGDNSKGRGEHVVTALRARSLADTVGPNMRLLMCGLNPSLNAADAGIGFFKNGNRYWPAALAAGLVSVDRDPVHALDHHGIGMTDIVKRATARADEVDADEFRQGMERLERLVTWLRPGAICFVGLVGWRTAVDRKAKPGIQPNGLGGRPVYVMPSTSGLNARTSLDELTDHLRAAADLATST